MTVVILDRFPGPPPPYGQWLRDAAVAVLVVTERAVGGYEQAVLDIARGRQITAIVATAGADLVRAGALRDQLGVPGQSRASARLFTDPFVLRAVLAAHGVPTVAGGPVHRVSDLYRYAHRWGYPVRVRERRPPAWPTVAVLRDGADLRAFTAGGLAPDASLLAEPVLADVSRRLAGPAHAALMSTLDDVLGVAHPRVVHGVRDAAGGWLVDTVACDVDPANTDAATHRAAVRAQAGLAWEVSRWAS